MLPTMRSSVSGKPMGYGSLRAAKDYWPTGKAGFGLGGKESVVHWHGGGSETYPIEGLKSNSGEGGGALARGSNGSFWVGFSSTGPGEDLDN